MFKFLDKYIGTLEIWLYETVVTNFQYCVGICMSVIYIQIYISVFDNFLCSVILKSNTFFFHL